MLGFVTIGSASISDITRRDVMAGSLSDYAEETFLNHVFNTADTAPAAHWLALHTANPDEDASGAECSGGSYARTAITFGAASGRNITQSGDVDFPTASGAWGTVSHWSVWTLVTGGSMLAYGSLATSKVVTSGNQPTIATTECVVTVSANGVSNHLAPIMLDWILRAQAYTQPDIWVALADTTISDSTTGTTISEPSGNGYVREEVDQTGGWDEWAAGVVDNTSIITFGPPSGSWGNITDIAIIDASATGNILMYDPGAFDEIPDDGDTVTFAAGALDVTLD